MACSRVLIGSSLFRIEGPACATPTDSAGMEWMSARHTWKVLRIAFAPRSACCARCACWGEPNERGSGSAVSPRRLSCQSNNRRWRTSPASESRGLGGDRESGEELPRVTACLHRRVHSSVSYTQAQCQLHMACTWHCSVSSATCPQPAELWANASNAMTKTGGPAEAVIRTPC